GARLCLGGQQAAEAVEVVTVDPRPSLGEDVRQLPVAVVDDVKGVEARADEPELGGVLEVADDEAVRVEGRAFPAEPGKPSGQPPHARADARGRDVRRGEV